MLTCGKKCASSYLIAFAYCVFPSGAGPGSLTVTKMSCTSYPAQRKSKACFCVSFVMPLASIKKKKQLKRTFPSSPTRSHVSRIACAIERVYVSKFNVHGHVFSAYVGKFPCLSSSPIVESKYTHSSYGLNRITTTE